MMKPTTVLAAGLSAVMLSAPASAHDVKGRISSSGVDFIEAQIPTYIPDTLDAPEFTKSLLCMDATQRDTKAHIEVHSLDLYVPEDGVLGIDIELSAIADGTLYVDDPYACLGEATCSDHLELHHAHAHLEFEVQLENGMPHLAVSDTQMMVDKDDVVIQVSDCAIDSVLETIADFGRRWFLDYLIGKLEDAAGEKIGPLLEGMIGGFTTFQGSIDATDFTVSFDSLELSDGGIDMGADVDLTSMFPADECVADDPGEPSSQPGSAPDLTAAPDADVGFAVNIGLLDDALYHMWRAGLTCVTDDQLAALGLQIDLDPITKNLPGFPAGTEFSMAAHLDHPPRVTGQVNDDLQMSVVIEGAGIDLTGRTPSGDETTLHLSLDVVATGTVGINPQTNALGLNVNDVQLQRLGIDQTGAAEVGFDVARLRQVLEDYVMPEMLGKMGELPLTGSVFGFDDYALIMRKLWSNDSHLAVKADLFRAPAVDENAPDTKILEYPSRVVRPDEAVLLVTGTDQEIPTELLQYQVNVNDVARDLTYVRAVQIGEVGVTDTYRVSVAAVDLKGNVDPTPEEVELTVDGVAPRLATTERLRRMSAPGPVKVAWTVTDDLTADEALSATVELYRVTDPGDALAVSMIDSIDVPAGQHETEVEVPGNGIYRVEVHVTDEAGNDGATSMMVEVKSGGCAASGRGASLPAGLALLFALVVFRRRR